jgi:flagellin
MKIDTVANANTAIQVIDAAIATISSTRADLGATQNRFDSIVSGLQVASDNQSAARSRIVDADFAKETATLTRGQILQQAGIAVLAQANAAPQNVLSLLQ